jgi:hypothetical protein
MRTSPLRRTIRHLSQISQRPILTDALEMDPRGRVVVLNRQFRLGAPTMFN